MGVVARDILSCVKIALGLAFWMAACFLLFAATVTFFKQVVLTAAGIAAVSAIYVLFFLPKTPPDSRADDRDATGERGIAT